MESPSDETLVARYLEGDEMALRVLFTRYASPLYRFVRTYVTDADDAADVAEDAFVGAWRHLKRFDRSRNFKTWLFAIARNAAFDWLKKKKPTPFREYENEAGDGGLEETLASDESSLEEWLDRETDAARMSEMLGALSVDARAVLVLRYYEELSFHEIGEALGVSPDTAKTRHRRALLSLKKAFEGRK